MQRELWKLQRPNMYAWNAQSATLTHTCTAYATHLYLSVSYATQPWSREQPMQFVADIN